MDMCVYTYMCVCVCVLEWVRTGGQCKGAILVGGEMRYYLKSKEKNNTP